MKKRITIAIVDDSTVMRKAIQNMLADDPEIEVIGFGSNGEDALNIAVKLKPDVMTLDVDMPKVDGLQALEKIMEIAPLPVIMVSALTQTGAEITLRALDAGAVDFLPKSNTFGKESGNMAMIARELKDKIHKFAQGEIKNLGPLKKLKTSAAPTLLASKSGQKKIVVIGTSTGGPQSLQKVLPMLPENLDVPVLVVQHMPPSFTSSLANRLNNLSKLKIIEAQGGEHLMPNYVYIAPGGKQMKVISTGGGYKLAVEPEDSKMLYNPSVDITTYSVAENFGADALGVIMTGMGNDGVKGMRSLKEKGGLVISQDEATCIVYGMPKAIADAGISDEVVSLDDIANRIVYHCKA